MTRVLVVRHGQSEWNAAGRWQGQADPPLTELGRSQARASISALRGLEAIVSSDLRRSRETAEIIRAGLGMARFHLSVELRERDAGEWTGLTRPEIEAGWPGFLDNGDRPPGYEPDEALRRRALLGIREAVARTEATRIVVVSHAGVVYALEAHAGLEFQRVPNLSGRWFEIEGGRLHAGERVTLIDPDEVETTVPDQI